MILGSRKPMSGKLQKYVPVPESGCWIWLGSTDKDEYGTIHRAEGSHLKAHRESYQFHVGAIPQGKQVLHRCDTPCCINPSHLYLGTPKEKGEDKVTRGRMRHTAKQWADQSKYNLLNPRPHDPITGRFV